MILFGLLRSMVECFLSLCYGFFLFFSGFGYGLGLLDIEHWTFVLFRFSSHSIPVIIFASTSPVGSEATHLRLTIDFYPF